MGLRIFVLIVVLTIESEKMCAPKKKRDLLLYASNQRLSNIEYPQMVIEELNY